MPLRQCVSARFNHRHREKDPVEWGAGKLLVCIVVIAVSESQVGPLLSFKIETRDRPDPDYPGRKTSLMSTPALHIGPYENV